MDLQDIPDKVFEENLLQHLEWNDLLRLRRVCKRTKKITDLYLKSNPDRAPELEINEEKDKSFGAFLEMGIPTSKLFISNPSLGYRFYEDDKVEQFLEDYGPLVKNLRVTQITLWNNAMCRDKELTFMEGLPNLKSLEVEYCSSGRSGAELEVPIVEPPDLEDMPLRFAFPGTFKKLEKVKIGRDPKDTDLRISERKKRTREFLFQNTKLRSISMPICWLDQTPEGVTDTGGTLYGDLMFLLLSHDEGRIQFGFEQKVEVDLEWIEIENCHENYGEWLKEKWSSSLPFNWHASLVFLTLIKVMQKKNGIKLGKVMPYWYYAKDSPNLDGTKADNVGIGEPVVSLVGLDPIIMNVDMPNLEKITIPSTCFCVTGGGKRPKWPSLKSFDITVDGNKGFCYDFVGVTNVKHWNGDRTQDTDNVFAFLFCNVVRPSVTEFHLKFKENGKVNSNSAVPKPINMENFVKEGDEIRWGREDQLSVPSTGMIVKCCRNLKVLKLGNWQGTNQALLVFWNGLGGKLEEVELENCGNVADFTFFGKDKEKPAFLKLKKLKKLSLKGLNKMSKVTDLLFMRILSQMKLKRLVLTSDDPLEKITKEGISSLLQGPFAESIERFPFQGWSLADVTPKEFEELGQKFRSYNML